MFRSTLFMKILIPFLLLSSVEAALAKEGKVTFSNKISDKIKVDIPDAKGKKSKTANIKSGKKYSFGYRSDVIHHDFSNPSQDSCPDKVKTFSISSNNAVIASGIFTFNAQVKIKGYDEYNLPVKICTMTFKADSVSITKIDPRYNLSYQPIESYGVQFTIVGVN